LGATLTLTESAYRVFIPLVAIAGLTFLSISPIMQSQTANNFLLLACNMVFLCDIPCAIGNFFLFKHRAKAVATEVASFSKFYISDPRAKENIAQ
jgi:hypothetical protein